MRSTHLTIPTTETRNPNIVHCRTCNQTLALVSSRQYPLAYCEDTVVETRETEGQSRSAVITVYYCKKCTAALAPVNE